MQRQDRESLCGVESKMFVQRQLSPENMVVVVVMEWGVGVEVLSYSHPAQDSVSYYQLWKK